MTPRYILDTNSLQVFGNYYPDSFPTFWDQLAQLISDGGIVSCREVRKELERRSYEDHLNDWIARYPQLFGAPTEAEMGVVADIFAVTHFRQLIGQKQQLTGSPVADPFLVARGAALNACVVTEEVLKPNAAKVPNVCEHFGVQCTNVQGLLSVLGWRF